MSIFAVLTASLALQHGYGMQVKTETQSSVEMMDQNIQLAEQLWPSASTLLEDEDLVSARRDIDFSADEDPSVHDAGGVEGDRIDEHAQEVVAEAFRSLQSLNFKETVSSRSEFHTLATQDQSSVNKAMQELQQRTKSTDFENFFMEGIPKLVTSLKHDPSFMTLLEEVAAQASQPAEHTLDAAAPLIKKLHKAAPRILNSLYPRVQRLLKSHSNVSLLQMDTPPNPPGLRFTQSAPNLRSALGDPFDAGLPKLAGSMERLRNSLGGGEIEDAIFKGIVPLQKRYFRTQGGFHIPIPLTCKDGSVCFYLDVGWMMVKLFPGPGFWILRVGPMFRFKWGMIHMRAFIPDPTPDAYRPTSIYPAVKSGFEVGYNYDPQKVLPPADNSLEKFSGVFIGLGPAWKNVVCQVDENLDPFWFMEPMLGFKVSFKGVATFWTPMVRLGKSFEDTGHQAFALVQPIALNTKDGFLPPKQMAITAGALLHLKPSPPSNDEKDCVKEKQKSEAPGFFG